MKLLPLILALPLAAQAQGVVEGSVRSSVNHGPIPKVKVSLTGPKEYRATTDENGAFRIADVTPGEYTAAFQSSERFEGNWFSEARRPLRVNAGGDPIRVQVDLIPMGRISGRLFDGEGRPVAKVQVEMIRLRGGGASVSGTDETGRFSVAGMGAGSYILLARPMKNSRLKALDPTERAVWSPVFYPNGLERSQAQPIVIRAGSDLSGYDLRLRTVPVQRVRGIVLDADGRPAPRAKVKMMPEGWYLEPEAEVVSGSDGTFEFPGVRAGAWQLLAELGKLKGTAELTVSQRDLEDVRIRLSAPFTLNGFVERDEPRDSKGERKLTFVYLIPADSLSSTQNGASHQQDGSIQIKDVVPGRYSILPAGFVPGYYVESVKLGDEEVFGRPVQLTAESPPFRVTFKPNAPQVRGTVEKCGGAAVVLVPQDEAFLDIQFIRSATCQADGRFEVGSLRPGDYYAFAFDRVDDWAAFTDAAFVRMLVSGAVRVQVKAGESASVAIKVAPWPE